MVQEVFSFESGFWYMHQTRTALEFVYGMALAVLFLRRPSLPVSRRQGIALMVLVFCVSVALLVVAPDVNAFSGTRFLFVGIPSAGLLTACLIAEKLEIVPKFRFPFLLGSASYSLYLVHLVVVTHLPGAMRDWGVSSNPTIFVSVVLISVGLSLVVYYMVEKPALRASRAIARAGTLQSVSK